MHGVTICLFILAVIQDVIADGGWSRLVNTADWSVVFVAGMPVYAATNAAITPIATFIQNVDMVDAIPACYSITVATVPADIGGTLTVSVPLDASGNVCGVSQWTSTFTVARSGAGIAVPVITRVTPWTGDFITGGSLPPYAIIWILVLYAIVAIVGGCLCNGRLRQRKQTVVIRQARPDGIHARRVHAHAV